MGWSVSTLHKQLNLGTKPDWEGVFISKWKQFNRSVCKSLVLYVEIQASCFWEPTLGYTSKVIFGNYLKAWSYPAESKATKKCGQNK